MQTRRFWIKSKISSIRKKLTVKRFFIKKSQIQSSFALLDKEEHHHLSRVARIKPKDEVWLFDEQRTSYLAQVVSVQKEHTKLTILSREKEDKSPLSITLAQSVLKSKKMELMLQKATELGIVAFLPVITSRTVAKLEDKMDKKIDRWKKIAIEAAKQCGRSHFPSVFFPQPLERIVKERCDDKKYFLNERGGEYLRDLILKESDSQESRRNLPMTSLLILIGSEGGWTPEEEHALIQSDYQPISMGRYILKAETAAISSLAIVNQFWNL